MTATSFFIQHLPADLNRQYKLTLFMPAIESGNINIKAILKSSRDVCDKRVML